MRHRRSLPVVIHYEDLALKPLVLAAARDFPADRLEVRVNRKGPAELQLAGPYEIVNVVLDPTIVQAVFGLVGVGLAGAAWKAGGKVVELITEDVYEWTKRLMKRLCEDFCATRADKRSRDDRRGVRIHIGSNNDARFGCIFYLIYNHDGRGFDPDRLESALRVFQSVVRPAISGVGKIETIRKVIVQGWLGPGEESPRWLFHVETKTRQYYFPIVSPDGVVDWSTGSEDAKEWLRQTLTR
jgi:hypothetical protein